MLLYTHHHPDKDYARTIVTTSKAYAMPVKAFQHCQQPADAAYSKKIEPLAISLLSAEAPTRLSELKARIGEPR